MVVIMMMLMMMVGALAVSDKCTSWFSRGGPKVR